MFAKLMLACLLAAPIWAQTQPSPGGFGVSAEWLYLFTMADQSAFVIDSSSATNVIGKRIANDQSFHSGYRLESIYSFCNTENDVRLRWTHFPSFSESKTVTGSNLFGVLNHPVVPFNGQSGSATIDDEYHFFFLDTLFGQKLACSPCFSLNLQGGFQVGFLRLKEKVDYLGNTVDLRLKIRSKAWGIGPELGLAGRYSLWGCLDIVGHIQGALLVSERNAKYKDEQDGTTIIADVKNEPYWHLLPTGDLRVGLNYCKPCRRLNWDVEAGYELVTFTHGIQRILFVDNTSLGTSFNEQITFTLHGPYLHLGVAF